MTSSAPAGTRILGRLASTRGRGVVRMQDRLYATVGEVWSALTDRDRLDAWLGEIEGDLKLGGEFRARFHATGWEGTGRVAECEPRQRLRLVTKDAEDPAEDPAENPAEGTVEVTLAADGDHTLLTWEERGMPVEYLPAYGAGIQIHVEDLTAHVAGHARCDAKARFDELLPAYREVAVTVGE